MGESDGHEGRPLVGDVIAGKYRIENVAGEGGMGIVYEAEHVILRQRVAVKVLLPGSMPSSEAESRFSLEAAAIARIACEHVVRVMDAGSLPNGYPYLVMEYLDGYDLNEVLERKGTLPPSEAVDFALQALEALAHAHAAHVVHRDLKPANLFLARLPGGREIIKLVDFGISTSFDRSSDDDRILGSPAYMAPEQLRNGPVDSRTDLWALGIVLYELMAGTPPFEGTFSELVGSILGRDPIPLAEKKPGVPVGLSTVVSRCLKRAPDERWSSPAELAHALAPYGSGAWAGAVERIERALSLVAPIQSPRRFESLENALDELESQAFTTFDGGPLPAPEEDGPMTLPRPRVATAETFGATIPVPPSEAHVIVISPASQKLPSFLPLHSPMMSSLPPPQNALRILLIDDSELTLQMHADVLASAGFDVRATTDVSEFDSLLENWEPHLVLMDVMMPGITGDALCRRVKDRYRATVPVVLLSDLPREQLRGRAEVGAADAFFRKTADLGSLVDFVRNICALTYSPEDLPGL
ncbi:serine/threonine protein kinase [Labilithrix luteola]|uniref:Serine/threonine protein kinase n=1 Tax=Labilithrix luteola TaxID=1391654 RepID=A0A0K1Q823_9BACT|nr:protein kinase [Labilithrix luteola]AKV01560.1 serine/threonine protein kinase [Labilithrix luteola]